MQQISLTPFGRQPVTSALLAARQQGMACPALPQIDKWTLFTALRDARRAFGVTDRDLSVLYALLTFLPARQLQADAPLVVFPSNLALSDRAHGMAESTLRRHLAALVAAGLIWRQDSPNGKRYARRDAGGGLARAFGFDLRPLLNRADEITTMAETLRAEAEALSLAREALVLRLRDAGKLLAHARASALPGNWDQVDQALTPIRAALRRRLDLQTVTDLAENCGEILRQLCRMIAGPAEEMIASAAHSDRHHTNSESDITESESGEELVRADSKAPDLAPPALPLSLVLKACPDIWPYAPNNLASWRDLVVTVAHLRGMMGISSQIWAEAQHAMGPENAAVAVTAMLQRFARIANPGGYLRALARRATSGGFSPAPMIMALLRQPGMKS